MTNLKEKNKKLISLDRKVIEEVHNSSLAAEAIHAQKYFEANTFAKPKRGKTKKRVQLPEEILEAEYYQDVKDNFLKKFAALDQLKFGGSLRDDHPDNSVIRTRVMRVDTDAEATDTTEN